VTLYYGLIIRSSDLTVVPNCWTINYNSAIALIYLFNIYTGSAIYFPVQNGRFENMLKEIIGVFYMVTVTVYLTGRHYCDP
jgi:hypothetical protein